MKKTFLPLKFKFYVGNFVPKLSRLKEGGPFFNLTKMSDRGEGKFAEKGRQFEVHENTSYLLDLFLYHFQKITRYSEFPMYYIFINWTSRALLLLQHDFFKIHEHDIFQMRPTLKGFTRYKVNTFSTYLQFHIKKTHNTVQNEECSSPSLHPHLIITVLRRLHKI